MMMCNLKWGVFVFFGVWQAIALVFTILLVPETRGVPIEKVIPSKLEKYLLRTLLVSNALHCL